MAAECGDADVEQLARHTSVCPRRAQSRAGVGSCGPRESRQHFAIAHLRAGNNEKQHDRIGAIGIVAERTTRRVNRADERCVEFATRNGVGGERERPASGTLSIAQYKSGAAEVQRAIDAIGGHVRHRAKHTGRFKRRDNGIAFLVRSRMLEQTIKSPAAPMTRAGRIHIGADENADA